MSKVKCCGCGANIEVNNNEETVCPYCGAINTVSKEIDTNQKSNTTTTVINNYYGNFSSSKENDNEDNTVDLNKMSEADIKLYYSPRPKIRVIPAIIGLCLLIIPGLIYIIVQAIRQKKWDKFHYNIKNNNAKGSNKTK